MATERNNAFLRGQLATLGSMIEKLPEESAVTRTSLEYRRSQVVEELEANPPPAQWPLSANLRFGGMPVTEHGLMLNSAQRLSAHLQMSLPNWQQHSGTIEGTRANPESG